MVDENNIHQKENVKQIIQAASPLSPEQRSHLTAYVDGMRAMANIYSEYEKKHENDKSSA